MASATSHGDGRDEKGRILTLVGRTVAVATSTTNLSFNILTSSFNLSFSASRSAFGCDARISHGRQQKPEGSKASGPSL